MDEPIRAPDPLSPGKQRASLLSFAPLGIWLALAGLFGGVVGLGGFTFSYANGLSYLSNDPKACVNCHVMREQFDGWNRGSHKHVAVCNDCHTPHDFIGKWAVKGLNGVRHSTALTFGGFPEPIRITPLNRTVTEHTCLYCHGPLVEEISHQDAKDPTDCLTCHAGVGHGK